MRMSVERSGARIWFQAPDGRRASLVMGDALGLAEIVERMDAERGRCDVRIQNVGVRRIPSGSAVTLHGDDGETVCPISDFDVGTLANLIRLAVSSRIFAGSIGLIDEETVQDVPQPSGGPAPRGRIVDVVPRPTTSAPPRYLGGGTLSGFDFNRRRRPKQSEPCRPRQHPDRPDRSVHTFQWQPLRSHEVDVVDAMPPAMYAAVRALWHRFEENRWTAIEWVRNYAGTEVWRTTRRDRPVTSRVEVPLDIMAEMERHGMVSEDGPGLRVPSQVTYEMWRVTMMAGGLDYRDERMSSPVNVPVGFTAPGIERVADLGTCIVSFDRGRATVHPCPIDSETIGSRLLSILAGMGIADPRTAEIAIRLGDWLYPERHSYYGNAIHHRLGRSLDGSIARSPGTSDIGWDPHFAALTQLPSWQERAIERYRVARQAPALPRIMPDVRKPDDWRDDPLLREGAEKRYKQLQARKRPKQLDRTSAG